MENKEIIQYIVTTNKEPQQSLTTDLVLYFKNPSGGYKNYNVNTGKVEIFNTNEDSRYCYKHPIQNWEDRCKLIPAPIYRSPSKKVYSKYAKCYNIDGIKVLEISVIGCDAHQKLSEPRKWYFINKPRNGYSMQRLFLFEGDVDIYDENGDIWKPNKMGKFYNTEFTSYLTREYSKLEDNVHFSIEIDKFVPIQTLIDASKYAYYYSINNTRLVNPWMFAEYYKKCKPRTKSKKAQTFETINSNIPPIDIDLDVEYPCKETISENKWTNTRLIVFQSLGNDWGVFRGYRRDLRYNYSTKEIFRVLISPKGEVRILKNINGEWGIHTSDLCKLLYSYGEKIPPIINRENYDKISHLKYIEDIVFSTNGYVELNLIINCLRHPIIELCVKSGYPNIAGCLCSDNKIAANLKNLFDVKEKKGKITEIFELNKYQLNWIEKHIDVSNNAWSCVHPTSYILRGGETLIKNIKKYVDCKKISDLSPKSTDHYFTSFKTLGEYNPNWEYYLLSLDENGNRTRSYWHRWNGGNEIVATELNKKRTNHIIKACKNDSSLIRAYADTISMFANLSPDYKPHIDMYEVENEDIVKVHDLVLRCQNMERAERDRQYHMKESERIAERDKKFKKLYDKKVEKFAYSDGNFSIIVPTNCMDFINESASLNHCLARCYQDTYAEGKTNILFLRKNSCKTIPFYTIEVDNTGRLVQCHGAYNSYLGTHPEAIQFMIDWLKEKNIYYEKKILLSTSNGYSMGNTFIDESQFVW